MAGNPIFKFPYEVKRCCRCDLLTGVVDRVSNTKVDHGEYCNNQKHAHGVGHKWLGTPPRAVDGIE